MTTAKLEIVLPDAAWPAAITRDNPGTTVKPLAHVGRDGTGFGIALVTSSSLDEVLGQIEAHPSIQEVEVIGREGNRATVEFSTSMPLLLFSSQAAGTAIELPVHIEAGVATVEVTGSRERLSRLTEHLQANELAFDLVYVQEYRDPGGVLSPRQRELIRAAVDRGYYDTPRRCTLTELAEAVGIAKSTCSEILHRAEGQIIGEYVENLPVTDPADPPTTAE